MSAPLLLGPTRILVIENDPVQRNDLVRTLKAWGFTTYAAEIPEPTANPHQALLEDACLKARSYRCHLAIVDMRLTDDSDQSDTSGLKLVPRLAPTVSIILSGYGDRRTVKEALQALLPVPPRAYNFIGKEEGPEAIQEAINAAEAEIWRRRPVEAICPSEMMSAALMRRFFPLDKDAPPDEVDDVLRRLFPDAARLKLEPASASQRASGLPLRGRSVVFKVLIDNNTVPVLVKLAPAGEVQDELKNFNEIKGNIGGLYFAQPGSNPVELWDVGGMIYHFLGGINDDQAIAFSDFYRTHNRTPDEIVKALESFRRFWNLRAHKLPEPQARRTTVFAAYTKVWSAKWCGRLLEYQSHPLLETKRYLFPSISPLNPITWLINKIKLRSDGSHEAGGLPDTQMAMTHGDLHGGNLFVDARGEIWVIDYERTGFGPILQDWAELETDILTNLAKVDAGDWLDYRRLLVHVLEPTRIPLAANDKDFGSFDKEWRVISKLRALAAEDAGATEGLPYVWGLLLNALFRLALLLKEYEELRAWLSGQEKDLAEAQKQVEHAIERSLMLSGMICHRLDVWNRPDFDWLAEYSANE